MTEKILRKLFPFTIKLIEFRVRNAAINDWAEGIIKEKPDYQWIYENEGATYKLGVIEKS